MEYAPDNCKKMSLDYHDTCEVYSRISALDCVADVHEDELGSASRVVFKMEGAWRDKMKPGKVFCKIGITYAVVNLQSLPNFSH